MSIHEPAHRLAFYRAALAGLRFLEAKKPTGRRFGDDADALWTAFRGHLTPADRLDLLLRDADTEWPGSFGARVVFALAATAEDEPFGREWTSLDPALADRLWREATARPPATDPAAALAESAAAWDVALAGFDVPELTADRRLVVAGPSAVAAVADAFAHRSELSWSDQVLTVATPPGHRQLAVLAAVALGAREPGRLVDAAEGPEAQAGALLLVSADADPKDADAARRLASP